MTQRKYSIDEIDQMRRAVGWIHAPLGAYYKSEEDARKEQILRTYMLNGTAPEELEEAVQKMFLTKK